MIAQFPLHERQSATQRIGEQRLPGAVRTDNRPVLVAMKGPGSVPEDDVVAQPKGRISQREEGSARAVPRSYGGPTRSVATSLFGIH